MPRSYKKKPRTYTDEDVRVGLDTISKGKTVYAAAQATGVPISTLRRHALNINKTDRIGSGRSTIVPPEDEAKIVQVLVYLSRLAHPLDTSDLKTLVQGYVNQLGLETGWVDNRPGDDWVRQFKKRHDAVLSMRKAELLTVSRAKSLTPAVIDAFFQLLRSEMEELKLTDKPANVYNLDESGLSTDPRGKHVFVEKSGRDAYLKSQGAGKAMYSVLFCCNAEGRFLPPFVVYKALRAPYDTWTQGGPPGTTYATTPSGWMESGVFEEWFCTIFLEDVKKEHAGEPIILLFDGHGSHMTYKTASLARENNVTIICLPPHSSHALQPLDVAVFKPLKAKWREILKMWARESRLTNVDKTTFPHLLSKLWTKLDPQLAVSGFRGAGIVPLDPAKVSSRMVGGEGVAKRNGVPSPVKALKEAVLNVISPSQSEGTKTALANKAKRRSRVQAKVGEVLTAEASVRRLEQEEEQRGKKAAAMRQPKKKRKLAFDEEEKEDDPLCLPKNRSYRQTPRMKRPTWTTEKNEKTENRTRSVDATRSTSTRSTTKTSRPPTSSWSSSSTRSFSLKWTASRPTQLRQLGLSMSAT